MILGMAIKKGDRFALAKNWRGQGASHFERSPDQEFTCLLDKGTVLVATRDVSPMATGFHCTVEDMDSRLSELVPAEQRNDPGFLGASFVFFTGDIGALLTDEARSA